jgi:ergothioneine biosynthesis protein EgtB
MTKSNIDQHVINSLISDLKDARNRTLELVNGLNSQQLIGPKIYTVNPLLWEIGHVAYFYEFWILRHLDNSSSFLSNADALYDSINIAHDDRWSLPLLSLDETKTYMQQVLDAVIRRLKNDSIVTEKDIYLTRYALFHEDMHTEAFTYTRRTLNYPAADFSSTEKNNTEHNVIPLTGDVTISGGEYLLGATPKTDFCFDNEKWQHPIMLKPFSISRTSTSYQQFASFVDDGGYKNKQFWSQEGWKWLEKNKIQSPNGWKKHANGHWLVKQFDHWQSLPLNAAVIHINWFEANAWCRWAGRRLPSEAEWELAASGTPENINEKRTYPWGNNSPTEKLANMNSHAMGTIDVGALPDGDSAFGCRQMLGNTWEWVADTFTPYPGFIADMYADYSQPLFGQTKVLRGGAWPTRSRMIRNTWRTYYGPERNDVFAGFRSCAL